MLGENDGTISLNKYISDTGRCSRREADKLISAGRVLLNGEIAKNGNRVGPGDIVLVDGEQINEDHKPEPQYIAFNKPRGIICTTDERIRDNIIDFLKYPERIFPIGRLDVASEGLILLTNDGSIVNKILRAENMHEKEYIVRVNREITEAFVNKMASGIPILDTVTNPCIVEKLRKFSFRIVLTQGLNRQIRRMCEYLGYEVQNLKRIRIMNIHLGDLKTGEWRLLSDDEEQELKKLVNYS
jgi:23S rRNA pseudouridine2604 synthase